jgi:hypothetical protein
VNNPTQLSCHASGTAIDWNAPDHPNGSGGTFTDAQVGTIYQILAEVEGAVSWLQGYDEMHFEICVDATTLAGVAARLGAGPTPPTPPDPEPPEPPELEDDMPRRIITVYDNDSAVGMALDGPTGVVGLNNEHELNCVKAVIGEDSVANSTEILRYNEVLARGAAALRGE